MQLYEEMNKYGIPDVRITKEEWLAKYANTYNVIAITNDEYKEDIVFAAEDIIRIYLLEQAKNAAQQSVQRTACAECGSFVVWPDTEVITCSGCGSTRRR